MTGFAKIGLLHTLTHTHTYTYTPYNFEGSMLWQRKSWKIYQTFSHVNCSTCCFRLSVLAHRIKCRKSCFTNLLVTFEDWTRTLDQGYGVDVIYLDYSKAFDSVPHQRLLCKLKAYGIRGNLLSWLSNFLLNRLQRVTINGCLSDLTNVQSGVPQGSVLGPLLFILYVNGIPDIVEGGVRMFADDTKIYCHQKF